MPTQRPIVSVVVTDLDNTLFDWFEVWYRSFSGMAETLRRETRLDEADLYGAIRTVHQKHGTSEYSYLLDELAELVPEIAALRDAPGGPTGLRSSVAAYLAGRQAGLKLYPTVFKTLWELKRRGVLVVGYTESRADYTIDRIRRLGLDGLIDKLYSPAGLAKRESDGQHHLHWHPDLSDGLLVTEHHHTPEGALKPNPVILSAILEELGATPDQAIYVGDSLLKDIAMAQDVGVRDVHAKYGEPQDHPGYELLRKVSHWPEVTVREETTVRDTNAVIAKYSINAFGEILDLFDFKPFRASWARISDEAELERRKLLLDVWKKTVDVQQHFNDLELKIRNFAVTLLVAVVAGVGLALKDSVTIHFANSDWPLAPWIVLAGMFAWAMFYIMDRLWYHQFLYGAVKHGMQVEKELKSLGINANLTTAIGESSIVKVGKRELHSKHKYNIIYGGIFVALLASAIALFRSQTGSPATIHEVRTLRDSVSKLGNALRVIDEGTLRARSESARKRSNLSSSSTPP